jgi:hypothetical protein
MGELIVWGTWVSSALISYFGTISALFVLVAFLVGLWRDPHADIPTRVTRAGAAGTLPFGFVLILCAVDPSSLSRFSELPRAPLALGGIAIICIYFEAANRKSK